MEIFLSYEEKKNKTIFVCFRMSGEPTTNASPNSSQQQMAPVQRKLQKILDLKLESDKDLIESLKYLSSFFQDNNVRTRRALRSTIEKRSLTLNDQFEECFRVVKEQLDQVNNTVTTMAVSCDDMTQRLKVRNRFLREYSRRRNGFRMSKHKRKN